MMKISGKCKNQFEVLHKEEIFRIGNNFDQMCVNKHLNHRHCSHRQPLLTHLRSLSYNVNLWIVF
jgi:hypothetical protein